MDRNVCLLGDTTKDALILEVGPSYNPIAAKVDGWNVRTVDHATKAELEKKYGNWGVDGSRMEDVDYIWKGGALDAAIPVELHGRFERVLASHVIEHMPDMLSFLRSASTLLAPAGTLGLAVPDKRYTFDFFRPTTMASDVIAANMAGLSRHSAKTAFEANFYAALGGNSIAWNGSPPGPISLQQNWKDAVSAFNGFCNASQDAYIDLHASCFTPRSFELIILELGALRLCDLSVQALYRTGCYEFYVLLTKTVGEMQDFSPETITGRRRALFQAMLGEVEEGVVMMRRAEPSLPELATDSAPCSA